jgi:2Fe-2S iron-sulfur cluster binding domain/Pyridine nucleotide-disulphide oxidoreductase
LVSSEKLTIIFEGKPLECRHDTSVAVALWENGIRHISHSHKYGNPRGLTCARGHCTACLMRVNGEPNVRTCQTPVLDGMVVDIQDAGAFYGPPMQKILAAGGSLFPVGFYYKWFTKPAFLSRFFLNQIRPLTGVGRLPDSSAAVASLPLADQGEPTPSTDLGNLGTIIIGAGPSGLEAALSAASAGEGPVTIIDDHEEPGGQRASAMEYLADLSGPGIERFGALTAAHKRLQNLKDEFSAQPDITFHGGMRAIAGYKPAGLVLRQGHKLFTATFNRLVWAAGALDTLGLFPGNDTPGVVGPRAAYRLLQRDGLNVDGKRVLVIGGGLDLWLTAALLTEKGATVSLVLTESGWQSEVSAAVDRRWQLTTGLQLSTISSHGQDSVEATFAPRASTPGPAHSQLNLKADFAVICGRGKPGYDIPYQLGVDLIAQPELGGYVPRGADSGQYDGALPGGHPFSVLGEAAGELPDQQAAGNRKADIS